MTCADHHGPFGKSIGPERAGSVRPVRCPLRSPPATPAAPALPLPHRFLGSVSSIFLAASPRCIPLAAPCRAAAGITARPSVCGSQRVRGIRVDRTGLRCTSFHGFRTAEIFYPNCQRLSGWSRRLDSRPAGQGPAPPVRSRRPQDAGGGLECRRGPRPGSDAGIPRRTY